MLTENELKALADPLYDMFQQLETDCITTICERINEIGQVSATDAHRLEELSRIGVDIDAMEREIADRVGKSKDEIHKLLNKAAEAEYNGNQGVFDKLGKQWVPFAENKIAQSLITAMTNSIYENIQSIYGLSQSISGTTGFVNTNGEWQPMAKYYQETVDYAIMQVRTGQTDFYSAMRKSIKNLADNGMCYYDPETGRRSVSYKSGYTRRLDSSVRNAFMGGQQRISRQLAEIQGQSFGADGFEITYHVGPRPDHEWIGGIQVDMKTYQSKVVPRLNDYNCGHRAFPIVLGISTPTYSAEELARLKESDRREFEFEGKKYTAYTARQKQRQFETAMRREKDRAIALKAAGDKEGEKVAKAKATALNQKYKAFSDMAGLSTKPVRASVSGYTRGATKKQPPKKTPPMLPKKTTKKRDVSSKKQHSEVIATKTAKAKTQSFKTQSFKTHAQIDKMSKSQLEKGVRQLANEWYASGKSGISFGGADTKQAVESLLKGKSAAQLKKDYKSLTKRLKELGR